MVTRVGWVISMHTWSFDDYIYIYYIDEEYFD